MPLPFFKQPSCRLTGRLFLCLMPTPATAIVVTPPDLLSGQPGQPGEAFTVQPNGYLVTAVEPAAGNALAFDDTGLISNTVYSYRLKVTDGTGIDHYGPVATFTTLMTAADLAPALTALGGGTAGATVQALYVVGVGQTVIADGTSPTGFRLTRWNNAFALADDNYLRPRPTMTGAPCTAAGVPQGKGLYLPHTASAIPAMIGPADATTDLQMNGIVPNPLFSNAGCGYSITTYGCVKPGSIFWWFGRSDGTTNRYNNSSPFDSEPIADPLSGVGVPGTDAAATSKIILSDYHFVHLQISDTGMTAGNCIRVMIDGSIMEDGRSLAGDYTDNLRDFYLLDDSSFLADGSKGNLGQYVVMLSSGRLNRAQNTLLRTWAKQQSWAGTLWTDTRDYFLMLGDSEQEPMKGVYSDFNNAVLSPLAHIIRGYRGLPRMSNLTGSIQARSGNSPSKFQGPFTRWYADADFTDRAHVNLWCWEFVNSGSVAQNEAWLTWARTIFPSKVRIGTYNTQSNNGSNAGYDVAAARAHYLPSFADVLIDIFGSTAYTAAEWGDGSLQPSPSGPSAVHFVANHPRFPETYELFTPKWAIGNRLLRATAQDLVDVGTLTWEIVPNTPQVTLTTGAPTVTPSWVSKRVDYTPNPSAGTLAFKSRNIAVCTVDAVTGLITAQDVGQAGVDARDATTGGMGTVDIVVTSAPTVVPDTSTGLRASWRFNGGLTDSSGNGLTLTGVNTPTFVSGLLNQAMSLNGTTHYAQIADTTTLRLQRAGRTGWTISFWVKPTALAGVRFYTQKLNEWDLLGTLGTGDTLFRVFDGANAVIGSLTLTGAGNLLVVNAWNFVCLRVDLANKVMILQVNGVAIDTTFTGTPNVGTTNPLCIGANQGALFVPGLYDQFTVFDVLKSQSDVTGLKNGTTGLEV
jgi:hypothetical protein